MQISHAHGKPRPIGLRGKDIDYNILNAYIFI